MSTRSAFALPFACALALVTCAGCAEPPAPRVVRLGDVGRGAPLSPGQALVVELVPGDEIPLAVTVEGPLVASPEGLAPLRLKVLRRFFLRIDEDGLATSLDGKTFGDDAAPGAFRFGVGATKVDGVAATITIRTPTPREPGT